MMKLILSRKGFDSASGGFPSPILPDGTLLSLPIPSEEDCQNTYAGLYYNGMSYQEIIDSLNARKAAHLPTYCHLDPDIRKSIRQRENLWRPSFGQMGAPLTHLRNQGVKEGDFFLFFGLFKETEINEKGKIQFIQGAPERHIIYGYLQIEKVITTPAEVPYWLNQHPHVAYSASWMKHSNAIFVASDTLSFNNDLSGASCLNFRNDRVLTKDGMSCSRWNLPDFFREVTISSHPNPWKENYFQSVGRGQEFVMDMTPKILEWVKDRIIP